jgi:NADH-quinone oxidoreductase subunit J
MDYITALFYVFSAILLFAGFRVITARNPVHAALYLVLAFFNAACVWLLLRAEFLAIVLVLVYVGAVMVLFLFVVMMLDVDVGLRAGFWRYFPLAAAVGVVIALEMAAVLLLVAIISAISLTQRRRKDTKQMDPADQIRVRKADRVRLVPLEPALDVPAPADAILPPVGDRR